MREKPFSGSAEQILRSWNLVVPHVMVMLRDSSPCKTAQCNCAL